MMMMFHVMRALVEVRKFASIMRLHHSMRSRLSAVTA